MWPYRVPTHPVDTVVAQIGGPVTYVDRELLNEPSYVDRRAYSPKPTVDENVVVETGYSILRPVRWVIPDFGISEIQIPISADPANGAVVRDRWDVDR